jgi:hypothetical protein
VSAVATVPSLRETIMAGLRDAIGHRQDTGHGAGCGCADHIADRQAASDYRLALELIEATNDNGEVLAIIGGTGETA